MKTASALAASEVRDWKILDVDAKGQIATLTSTSTSSSASHLRQQSSKKYNLQYVIGQLLASMHRTACNAKKQE